MFDFSPAADFSPPPLLTTPANPAPGGAELLAVRTRDGVRLRAARWRVARPRGAILLLQGRAEFIEKYFEVVGELLARGFDVVTFDWRGQGGSARALRDPRRGHVADFAGFRLDVEAVLAEAVDPLGSGPLGCMAHSMGGCIALIGAREGWLPAERLVALAPMVALSLVRQPRPARALARLLQRLGLGNRYVPGGVARSISTLPFRGNRLCGDAARYGRNAAVATAIGPGAIGSPTVDWLAAAYEAMATVSAPGYLAALRMPTLLVAAGADAICSTPAMEALARDMPAGRLLAIAGARHEILMETDAIRDRFWEAFDAFMDEPVRLEAATG